jgi:hypothetical protein
MRSLLKALSLVVAMAFITPAAMADDPPAKPTKAKKVVKKAPKKAAKKVVKKAPKKAPKKKAPKGDDE